jgi:hypothetical protein
VATKLDPFRPILETRLTAFPELSAVRLLEEIRAAGYTGGYSQLKEAVRRLRPVLGASRHAPAGRIGRRPKARWSGPSGTFGRISSTAARS